MTEQNITNSKRTTEEQAHRMRYIDFVVWAVIQTDTDTLKKVANILLKSLMHN